MTPVACRPDVHLPHRRVRADRDAETLAGTGKGLGDRAHAADDVSLPGLLVGVAAGQQVKQQPHRGARLVGPAVLAIKAVGQDQPFQLVRLEAPVEEIAERTGEETHECRHLVAADPAKAAPQSQPLTQAVEPAGVHVRRRFEKERLQVRSQLLQFLFSFEEALDVARRDPFKFRAHPALIGPPGGNGPAVLAKRGLHPGIAGDHPEPEVREFQVPDYGRPQHARDVGRGGHAAARRSLRVDLLGDGASAHDRAALDHQHAAAGPGEIGRGHEAVVAGADDDDVVSHGLRLPHNACWPDPGPARRDG